MALCGLLLSSCAMPDVVPTMKPGDESLSRTELKTEITHCEMTRRELEGEKGVNVRNAAALVFFWPALVATYVNVSDATKALDRRHNYLMGLYNKKEPSYPKIA